MLCKDSDNQFNFVTVTNKIYMLTKRYKQVNYYANGIEGVYILAVIAFHYNVFRPLF